MTPDRVVTPEKIESLRDCGLYEILFRNAGVGCVFYTGPSDLPKNWRDSLVVDRYYPTFTEAIDAEYLKRISGARGGT